MKDKRELFAEYLEERNVTKQRNENSYRYVGLFDCHWDLSFEYTPYDTQPSILSLELGLLPLDDNKKNRAIRKILEWNHSNLKHNPFGLIFKEDGKRISLTFFIEAGKISEKEAKQQFKDFLVACRRVVRVIEDANAVIPADSRML